MQKHYWDVPNILMQKFPADKFLAAAKLTFHPLQNGDRAGFIVMGLDYAYLSLSKKEDGIYLSYSTCKDANKGNAEKSEEVKKLSDSTIYLSVKVDTGAVCYFSYSIDGNNFNRMNKSFKAQPGQWIGAKIGIFCTSSIKANDSGYADFDWFRIEPF
jgi:beta-xylosidase